jgi:hypothetical protein
MVAVMATQAGQGETPSDSGRPYTSSSSQAAAVAAGPQRLLGAAAAAGAASGSDTAAAVVMEQAAAKAAALQQIRDTAAAAAAAGGGGGGGSWQPLPHSSSSRPGPSPASTAVVTSSAAFDLGQTQEVVRSMLDQDLTDPWGGWHGRPLAPEEVAEGLGLSQQVVEQQEVEGAGEFTAYADGRIRVSGGREGECVVVGPDKGRDAVATATI